MNLASTDHQVVDPNQKINSKPSKGDAKKLYKPDAAMREQSKKDNEYMTGVILITFLAMGLSVIFACTVCDKERPDRNP